MYPRTISRLLAVKAVVALAAAAAVAITASGPAGATTAAASTTGSAAAAGCQPPDGNSTIYLHTNHVIDDPTSLHSDWLVGPGTITRVDTKSTSKSAQIGGGVSGGVEFWIIKIGGEVNATLTKTWTRTTGWDYSKPVPAGVTARMMYFHRTVRTHVREQAWYQTTCSYHTVHEGDIMLPFKTSNYDVWNLQKR